MTVSSDSKVIAGAPGFGQHSSPTVVWAFAMFTDESAGAQSSSERFGNQAILARFTFEIVAKVRVRQGDHRLGPLRD